MSRESLGHHPSRSEVLAAAVLFVFGVHWSYRVVISPAWDHAGLVYQPASDGSLIFALLVAMLPAVWLPRRVDRVSTIALWVLYAVPFVPATLVPHYVLGGGWSIAPLNIGLLLSLGIPMVAQRLPVPAVRLPSVPPRVYGPAVAGFGVIAAVILVAALGLGSLPGFDEIYQARADYKDRVAEAGRLVGYLIGAVGTVVFPFLIVLGLSSRRYILLGVGLAGVILVYSITGYRSVLFSVPLAVAIYLLLRHLPARFVTVALLGMGAAIGISVMLELVLGTGAASTLFIRRMLSVPGQLTGYYFDFFSTHPTYELGHSVLGWLSDPPYKVTPPRLISIEYFGNDDANANANLWADGFANFGMLGLISVGILLAGLLWVADVVSRRKPLVLAAPVFVAAAFSMTNSGLLTSLLSHGIVAALILLALMPDRDSAPSGDDREPPQVHRPEPVGRVSMGLGMGARRRYRMLIALTAAVAMGATLAGETVRALTPPLTPFELAAVPMAESGIGVGGDVLLPRASAIQHPMAIALYASAHAQRASHAPSRDALLAAANELLATAETHDRAYGWGLKFRWDAFADGSTNPAETVYGITTAMAVRSLLDAHDVGGGGDDRYLAAANRALDMYALYFSAAPDGGYFWYSDREVDSASVLNVSAMLASQYARASAITGDETHERLARDVGTYLLAHGRRDSSGALYWPYRVGRDDPNDAVHAAYIVEGLFEIDAHLGLPGFNHDAALAHLRAFVVGPELVTRFVGGPDPDRSWGVGQLLYVFCRYADDPNTVADLRGALRSYEYAPGHYGPHPEVEVMYPRFQGHVLLGLGACSDDDTD